MRLDEYLSESNNITWDFTMDCDCEAYRNLQNPIERYFVYRSLSKNISGSCYTHASEFSKSNIKRYAGIGDPDLYSNLLQEIYQVLWSDLVHKSFMVSNGRIQSDTMTSAQKTINLFIETKVESIEERAYRRSIGNGRNVVSDAYCIELFLNKPIDACDNLCNRIKKFQGVESFLAQYHSLGNYIAVPHLFNAARSGHYASHDYWDLTMMKIRAFYYSSCEKEAMSEIEELLHGKGNASKCRNWLDFFGVGAAGWKNFVNSNFLQDYVQQDGQVIPFCKGHTWEHPQIDDCIEFFTNVSKVIYLRGQRMFDACRNSK